MAKKQETIEKVAFRLYPIDMEYGFYETSPWERDNNETYRDIFLAGAKHQQKLTPWSDADMVSYASLCYFNRDDNVAFSDLLSDYKQNLTK